MLKNHFHARQRAAFAARALPWRGMDGSITVFGLMALVGMIGLGGLAVDTMNYEGKRIAAQDAMDRCSLMAALAQNRADGQATDDDENRRSNTDAAEEIAEDCMEKSVVGNSGLNDPSVTTANSERTVTLTGNFTFNGVFPLATSAGNTATKTFPITSISKQKLPNLEISVAVDTSNPTFWTAFKPELKTLLNTIASPDTGGKVSVNLVPFTSSVTLGQPLIERFNDANKPTIANTDRRTCFVNEAGFTDSIAIKKSDILNWSWPFTLSGSTSLGSTGAIDFEPGTTYGTTVLNSNGVNYKLRSTAAVTYNQTTQTGLVAGALGLCNRNTSAAPNATAIAAGLQVQRPITTGSSAVNNAIDAVSASVAIFDSNSNSALGLKWGLALLDPSDQMTEIVGEKFAGRPQAYGAADSLKVLILAPNNIFLNGYGVTEPTVANRTTTSAHAHRELRPLYMSNTLSGIFVTPETGTTSRPVRVSIFHADAPDPAKPYWVTQGLTTTQSGEVEGSSTPSIEDAQWMAAPFKYPTGANAVQLTWAQVFTRMTMSYVIRQLYMVPLARPAGNPQYHWPNLIGRFTTDTQTRADAIADFQAMCTEAKSKGVLIYVLLGTGVGPKGLTANPTAADIAYKAAFDPLATEAEAIYRGCATSPAYSFSAGNSQQIRTAIRVIASNIAQLTLTQ